MSQPVIVFMTIDTLENAQKLAHGLVESRLAACVNILPGVQSVYRWEGAIHNETELLLICKTLAERYADLEAWVKANHPYSVPEIIQLPIQQGYAPYLDWIRDNT